MIKSLLKVQNLREKQEVLLPHQSAGGVDLSHGTLTGMANMTRLVVEFVDGCLFCFFFCGDGKYDQIEMDKNHPAKTFNNKENGRVWANMTKLLKMTIPIHMTTEI